MYGVTTKLVETMTAQA